MEQIVTEDLALFRELLEQHTGFVFPVGLESEFSYRLSRAMQDSNITMPQLLTQLRFTTDSTRAFDLLAPFLPQLLIGETYFWRGPETFEALTKVILPELVQRKANYAHLLRVWSAACSSGEETWSLSILLRHFFANTDWMLSILGTDINSVALQLARQGEYGDYSFRGMDKDHWLYGCFDSFSNFRRHWRIKNQYRQGVRFQSLNLADNHYPSVATDTCSYDLIFCRNIFIYFKPELSALIIQKLYNALNEGGYLVVSPCEYSSQLFQQFEAVQIGSLTFYRKPSSFAATPKPVPVPLATYSWEAEQPKKQPVPVVTSPLPLPRPKASGELLDKISMLNRVKTALQANQLEEVRQLGLQICATKPLAATGYLLLTIAYQKAEQFEEAYETARKTVYLEPTNLEGLFYLANLHQKFNNFKRAAQTWRRLLDLAGGNMPPFASFSDLTLTQLQTVARQNLAQLVSEEN